MRYLLPAALLSAVLSVPAAATQPAPRCTNGGPQGRNVAGSMHAYYQTPAGREDLGCRALYAAAEADLQGRHAQGILTMAAALPPEARVLYVTQVYFGIINCDFYPSALPDASSSANLQEAVNRSLAAVEANRQGQARKAFLGRLAETLLTASGVDYCSLQPGYFDRGNEAW